MPSKSLTFTAQARVLASVGLGLWLLASACQVWEVLAVQSPDSPFHLGVLAGPVTQLRAHCFGLGTICVGLALLWPLFQVAGRSAPSGARAESGWWLLATFLSGALLETTALTWAATSGMLAVQVFDPRPDARFMLYLRALGHGLGLIAGSVFLWRATRSLSGLRSETDSSGA